MHCTLCGTLLQNKADEYYFICDTCGAYVKSKKYYINSEQERQAYETHNNDVNDPRYQKFTSPITNAILEKYTPEHLGLDFGSGTGPVISRQLLNKGYQVKLYDPYFHPSKEYMNHQYDYIFSCEVFEHFHQPNQEIKNLLSLLKPGGQLYIMTHLYNVQINFKNWYYRNDPTHVFIFTVKTIEFIAHQHNLKIEVFTDRFIVFKKPF